MDSWLLGLDYARRQPVWIAVYPSGFQPHFNLRLTALTVCTARANLTAGVNGAGGKKVLVDRSRGCRRNRVNPSRSRLPGGPAGESKSKPTRMSHQGMDVPTVPAAL